MVYHIVVTSLGLNDYNHMLLKKHWWQSYYSIAFRSFNQSLLISYWRWAANGAQYMSTSAGSTWVIAVAVRLPMYVYFLLSTHMTYHLTRDHPKNNANFEPLDCFEIYARQQNPKTPFFPPFIDPSSRCRHYHQHRSWLPLLRRRRHPSTSPFGLARWLKCVNSADECPPLPFPPLLSFSASQRRWAAPAQRIHHHRPLPSIPSFCFAPNASTDPPPILDLEAPPLPYRPPIPLPPMTIPTAYCDLLSPNSFTHSKLTNCDHRWSSRKDRSTTQIMKQILMLEICKILTQISTNGHLAIPFCIII